MEKKVKKHKASAECSAGKHNYMVTCWQIGGGKEKAIHVRCRHCLMPMDLEEIESAEWFKESD